jgi:hypothetical protein
MAKNDLHVKIDRDKGHLSITKEIGSDAGGSCALPNGLAIAVGKWTIEKPIVESAASLSPTKEGMRRHDPTGFYDGFPCTCKSECAPDCKGECGCSACQTAYSDFLSVE